MSEEIYESDYLEFYDPVQCIGDLGEKWCNFKWNIYDLQLYPLETIKSPIFTTRLLPKTGWYLQVQLLKPGNLTAIKISLRRLENAENAYCIVDVICKVTCYEETMISDKSTLVYGKETPGDMKFNYIASFHELKMGFVTVECKLRPNKRMIKNVRHDNLDPTLPVDLRKLLRSGELCDTVIQVGGQQLMAHHAIICARLPRLLPKDYEKGEKKCIIEINDLPLFVVKEMLKYAYTGQAYLDFKSVSKYKAILVKYRHFFYTYCWEDHPFAETSFNYETDSLEWDLNGFDKKEKLGSKIIHFLKIFPNELDLSLDVKEKNILTLSLEFSGEKMPKLLPKPTIISCKYSLVNANSKETMVLGQFETLATSTMTQAKMKLCSRFEILNAKTFLSAEDLILKTDFKFCYGSSKSSIENLYDGQFDMSQCSGCALLGADLQRLYLILGYYTNKDIMLEAKDGTASAHKCILIARWKEAKERNVKESSLISMEDFGFRDLCDFLRKLYSGLSYEYMVEKYGK